MNQLAVQKCLEMTAFWLERVLVAFLRVIGFTAKQVFEQPYRHGAARLDPSPVWRLE